MEAIFSKREIKSHFDFLISAAQITVGSIVIALLAQLQFQLWFTEIPISAQNISVMFVASILGSKRGTMAVLLYLFLGAIGLPVFTGANSGIEIFAGTKGGYLLGYILLAYLTGWYMERKSQWNSDLVYMFLILSIGHLIYGGLWVAGHKGLLQALYQGVLPFIPGNILKVLLLVAWLKSPLNQNYRFHLRG